MSWRATTANPEGDLEVMVEAETVIDLRHQRSSAPRLAPVIDTPPRADPSTAPAERGWLIAGTVAVVASVGLRFWTRSAMWLDEAQTIAIAKQPLSQIPAALRQDGSPPLYYFLLHGWMHLFGQSAATVRWLAGCFGVASLPAIWFAGRRIGGRSTAWTAVLLLASSPFAVRYSTENRMYALVVLLSLVGFLVVARCLDDPTPSAIAAVGGVTALLLLTHYWCMFLVGAGAILLAVQWRLAPDRRRPTGRTFLGVAAGSVLFLPWLPNFVWQSVHTSTPWSAPPSFAGIASAISDYGGGDTSIGWAVGLALLFLVAVGLFGRSGGRGQIVLELRPRPRARMVAALLFTTLGLALIGSMTSGSAITPRYTSIVFAFWLLLAALGTQVIVDERVRRVAVATIVALGLVGSVAAVALQRSEAPTIAAALHRAGQPNDVVAYCPDQLGPAVGRLGQYPARQYTFPTWSAPQMVDWVDYRNHIHDQSARRFANELDILAGANNVWLVWSNSYPGTEAKCTAVRARLAALRPTRVNVHPVTHEYENETLIEFPAAHHSP